MRVALTLILFLLIIPCLAQSDKANTLLEEAQALVEEKQYEAAVENYKKAANYFRRKKNKLDRSKALLQASETYLLLKETFKSQQLSIKIIKLNSSKSAVTAHAYLVLGKGDYLDGQLPEALKNFRKAKSIAENLTPKDSTIIGQSKRMIGATHNRLGQAEVALIHANEAMEIFEAIQPVPQRDIAATYGTLGEIFLKKNNTIPQLIFLEKLSTTIPKRLVNNKNWLQNNFFF